MKIWVDADACPNPIKEILFRAAERRGIPVTLVANQPLRTPRSRLIDTIQVRAGFDVADDLITERARPGDLVVTADIPLAAAVIANGVRVVTPRGEPLTDSNIGERLTLRDFMDELRGSGVQTGGPPPLGPADRQAFANALDKILTRHEASRNNLADRG